MNTSYFPQIKTVYTSDKFHGQVYIPFANWLMMIGTVIVTAVYNNVSTFYPDSYATILNTHLNANRLLSWAMLMDSASSWSLSLPHASSHWLH